MLRYFFFLLSKRNLQMQLFFILRFAINNSFNFIQELKYIFKKKNVNKKKLLTNYYQTVVIIFFLSTRCLYPIPCRCFIDTALLWLFCIRKQNALREWYGGVILISKCQLCQCFAVSRKLLVKVFNCLWLIEAHR